MTHRSSAQVNEFCHYATAAELDFLRTLAPQLPDDGYVMMLGAGPGVMMLAVVEGNPALHGMVIDHDTTQWAEAHIGPGYNIAFRKADSSEVGYWWEGPAPVLLIIDADHSYEGVKRDMIVWLPKVAPGGYVFFHDYSASGTEFADQEQYPGVALAIAMYLPKDYTTVARVGTAIVFRKP